MWKRGKVTNLISNTVAEVDRVNRHIADLRLCHANISLKPADESEINFDAIINRSIAESVTNEELPDDNAHVVDNVVDNIDDDDSDDNHSDISSSDVRDRKPPAWLADFYVF